MTSWLINNSEQKHNMCVAVPSTPAQYFHVLRRQIHRPFAKPLVVMNGKWLHIHSSCASDLAELGQGTYFRRVIVEGHDGDNMKERTKLKLGLNDPSGIKRVVFCSGQVHHDAMPLILCRSSKQNGLCRSFITCTTAERLIRYKISLS